MSMARKHEAKYLSDKQNRRLSEPAVRTGVGSREPRANKRKREIH
jgi:hypothetical protein